jgi:hypothetical protein
MREHVAVKDNSKAALPSAAAKLAIAQLACGRKRDVTRELPTVVREIGLVLILACLHNTETRARTVPIDDIGAAFSRRVANNHRHVLGPPGAQTKPIDRNVPCDRGVPGAERVPGMVGKGPQVEAQGGGIDLTAS